MKEYNIRLWTLDEGKDAWWHAICNDPQVLGMGETKKQALECLDVCLRSHENALKKRKQSKVKLK